MSDNDSSRSPGFRRMSLRDGKKELQTNDSDDEDGVNDGDEDSGVITLDSGAEMSDDQEAVLNAAREGRDNYSSGGGKKISKGEASFNMNAVRNIPSPPNELDVDADGTTAIIHQHSHYYTYSPQRTKIFTNLPLRNQAVLVLSQFWDDHPTIQYPSQLELEAWFLLTQRHHMSNELIADCLKITPKDPMREEEDDEYNDEGQSDSEEPLYHSTRKNRAFVDPHTLYSYTPAQEAIFSGVSIYKLNPIHNKILSRGFSKYSSQRRFVWLDGLERRLYWSKDETKQPYYSTDGKFMTPQSISLVKDVLQISTDGEKLLTFVIGVREQSPIHAPSDNVGETEKTLIFKIIDGQEDSSIPVPTLRDWWNTCMSIADDYVKIRSGCDAP